MFLFSALEKGTYETCGKMLAYLIVHNGPLPKFLSPMLYDMIAGNLDVAVSLDDVPDYDTKTALEKVHTTHLYRGAPRFLKRGEDRGALVSSTGGLGQQILYGLS